MFGIVSGVYFDILFFFPDILSGICSKIIFGIFSGILSGMLSNILSGILSGVLPVFRSRHAPLHPAHAGFGSRCAPLDPRLAIWFGPITAHSRKESRQENKEKEEGKIQGKVKERVGVSRRE